MYTLPDEWESFYKEMCSRAEAYIKISYWDISGEDLILWLKNFETDHERFLSAIIIYRLMYRNEQPRLSMYHHIIEMILPSILEENGIYTISSLDDFHNKLKHAPWSIPFRFATIENVDGQASKSGHQILRDFARKGEFHNNLKVSITSFGTLNTGQIKAIVLFDDFMGTGEQFDIYLQNINEHIDTFKFIYCPLMANKDAIDFIANKYPNVIVEPIEILDNEYTFFNKTYMPKIAENINMHDFKEFYIAFIQEKTRIRQDFLGRGNQGLTCVFDVSTPNNSLPIFSYNDEHWNAIFPR